MASGHFKLNSVFLSIQVQNLLIYLYRERHQFISVEREKTPSYACWKFVTCFSGRRLIVSMSSTIKQLNKILTAYDYLLILINCGIVRFIACDSTRVS